MKRLITCICLSLLLAACHDEALVRQGVVGNDEVCFTLPFGHHDFEEIQVATRATLSVIPESRVQNLFVYIFAADGERIYSHYFDNENKVEALGNEDRNCWTVTNMTAEGGTPTNGTMRIKSPVVTGGKLYMVANIDADMVNISPEKLNTIRTEGELRELAATLNQEITSRNGYFPMTGEALIDVADNGSVMLKNDAGTALSKVMLVRLDAKVKVNINVASGSTTTETDPDGVASTQTLKEFVPESWRVINLPKASYVVARDADYEQADKPAGYFDTEAIGFETHTTDGHGFSFYMLENREVPTGKKTSVEGEYHKRDLRVKNAKGEYDTTDSLWVHAPECATYMEIKGEIKMVVDVSSEARSQTLTAAVTYYVHLGDIATSKDNYDVWRNTCYTYTITIKGVNSIQVEVETSQALNPALVQEGNAGATGRIYVAQESLYTFDAHYGQRVFALDAQQIEPDAMTWYVKTPFGKEGVPEKVGDTEIPSGMDYKWVKFMVNKLSVEKNAQTDDYTYSPNNRVYPGDASEELMDIVELTKFIKEEKRKKDRGEQHLFRKEFDQSWYDKFGNGGNANDTSQVWWRDRIYITAFVDEFYYESNPITGETREDLWKDFVNQPNRLMHILCDSRESLDKASSSTGSIVTLRQRSIQTPYNTNKDGLLTAWGCETVDETAEHFLWFYNNDETLFDIPGDLGIPTLENTSSSNGLYNTACLWGLMANGAFNDVQHTVNVLDDEPTEWGYYMDYERPNDYVNNNDIYFLKGDYAVMRYASMMRNRDNNGNGKIDPDEVRWYLASIDQLYGLYMGELGQNSDAALYSSTRAAQTGTYPVGHHFEGCYKWREHIVSSTRSSANACPVVLWAEEGLSTSYYRQEMEWYRNDADNREKNRMHLSAFSARCVRNLGMDRQEKADVENVDNVPQTLVGVTGPDNGVYSFDLTNINDKSLRFYTTKELEPADESAEMARLYYGFRTGDLVNYTGGSYAALKSDLEAGYSPCPAGYRVPNVREAALMRLYVTDSGWWNGYIYTSSYYSLGSLGSNKDIYGTNTVSTKTSWFFGHNYASLDGGASKIRCVRDLEY
ncbi:MAG: DUF4906 domain-containing protein [Bacteroides sp.]|nr:DUF4906 domain-containing protein [Bacteroides sp.]